LSGVCPLLFSALCCSFAVCLLLKESEQGSNES
jgi:hypothetical protein